MRAKEVIEIIPPKNIYVGNPAAPVTLMEFGEYENEDCAKANELVKKLLAEFGDKLRFNFRHFPLTKIPFSVSRQIFGFCCGGSDVTWTSGTNSMPEQMLYVNGA